LSMSVTAPRLLAVSSRTERHAAAAHEAAGQKLHYTSRCATTILGNGESDRTSPDPSC
jgi:hypothetical protein